ncbi:MAG: glycosyltransferase family 4 protein [Opitutales bacterium]|nr:glycosyltransferase family 4 protein [Opitutales bacterium]
MINLSNNDESGFRSPRSRRPISSRDALLSLFELGGYSGSGENCRNGKANGKTQWSSPPTAVPSMESEAGARRIRVGLSTSVIQGGRSGIARYVLSLLKEFQRYHDRFQFVIFVLKNDMPLFDFLDSSVQRVEVSERFRRPVADILWHQVIVPRLAKKHALDVVHVPSYRRMILRAPCAKVATIHDLAPFRLSGKYDRARMIYGRMVARFLARQQDRIIAVSTATAHDIHRFYGSKLDKVTVIHNGIDHRKFCPGDSAKARAWVKEHHSIAAPFFLYVARFEHPGKNHFRLIEAFDDFKDKTGLNWQLVLGGSDWHGAETIHHRIRQSPYRDEIHTLGFVSDVDLPDWYRAAGVFVFPSLFEGFGLPPLEAMACACPVICSTRGSFQEIVGEAASLIDPEDTDALREKMTELATDDLRRADFRAKGIAWVKSFTWEGCAAEVLDVYRKAHESHVGRHLSRG